MLRALAYFSRITSRAALYSSFTGLVLMTAIISWQVFARYVLNAAPAWTEQAALLLMLWFILFAAAAGVREGFHIRLTLVEDRISSRRKTALRLFCHGVVLAFGAAMLWGAAGLVMETWTHTIPTLGVPRAVAYIPIALAGALIGVYAIELSINEIRGGETERSWP